MSSAAKLFLLAALASTAAAHGTVPGIVADGVYKGGWLLQYFYAKANGQAIPESVGWYAEDLDNGFVDGTTYATADIICHKNAAPANFTATVAAGGKVDFQWTVWPDSHIGPILTYVANCGGNCSSVDKTALKWVKIDEAGIDLSTQTWPTAGMIKNNNTWTVTVPSTLAAGSYVFRHEIIAMHAAGSLNGAQNYPQCVNIEVTGSGTENPEGTLGTELYKNTDPGIMFNPYTTLTSYTIPGPALFGSGSGSGGSGSGSGGGAATSAAAVPATSQAAASPTPATSAAAQPAPSTAETTAAAASPTTLATVTRVASTAAAAAPTTVGKVAMYQQCGGINFSGSTECVDGAVCKDWNPYYSQCIAA